MHTRALWVLCRSQPPAIKVHLISQPTSLLTCEIPLVFNNLYTTQFQSCGSVPHFLASSTRLQHNGIMTIILSH